MQELRPGLWHWEANHPGWASTEPWGPEVSSYALVLDGQLVLFDPLGVPEEVLGLAAQRVIVLTAPWHERDAQQLGVPVYTPPADTAADLIEKFGITAEQAGDGSPDLIWLRERGDGNFYAAGDALPLGVQAFPGKAFNDVVLWIESARALVAGDSLVDFGDGLTINERWLAEGQTREDAAAAMRPLLDLPVELVLPTHGAPTDRAALERALA
jgi:glyoxylase-like metal-dependent hydrolase (beta-lactamase superfamily II)